jgi:hypothetical protein
MSNTANHRDHKQQPVMVTEKEKQDRFLPSLLTPIPLRPNVSDDRQPTSLLPLVLMSQ